MAQLMKVTESEAQSIFESREQFKTYEMGRLTDQEFRDFIRSLSAEQLSDAMIDAAWNAMILDIPGHHFTLLSGLRKTHRVHLLSNTNSIHLKHVENKLKETGQGDFSQYFHNEFYSHTMGMRKPNRDIYREVLSQGKMEASTTLFLDDNLDNLAGAESVGINVYHVKKLTDTADFFNER